VRRSSIARHEEVLSVVEVEDGLHQVGQWMIAKVVGHVTDVKSLVFSSMVERGDGEGKGSSRCPLRISTRNRLLEGFGEGIHNRMEWLH